MYIQVGSVTATVNALKATTTSGSCRSGGPANAPRRKPGAEEYYVKYRPVFVAAAPGKKVGPGTWPDGTPPTSRSALSSPGGGAVRPGDGRAGAAPRSASGGSPGRRLPRRRECRSIVTYPHDYYPGTEWKSAMLWGAAEIALADERVGVPRPVLRPDLAAAARWAARISRRDTRRAVTRSTCTTTARSPRPNCSALCGGRPHSAGDRPAAAARRHGGAASSGRGVGARRSVRTRHRSRAVRRGAARVRALRDGHAVPGERRILGVRRVRPAAARLRARREPVGRPRSWSAPDRRTRTACRARSPTCPGR